MESILTPSNVMFALGIIGILFSVYRYFKDPQTKSEQTDALMKQQIDWQMTATEKRFASMQESFNSLLLQSNNHIHTVDTKVDKVNEAMIEMGKSIVQLSTIINERIPKK